MKIFQSISRIISVTMLILGAYKFGYYYGVDAGMITIANLVGPALYKCVELLPPPVYRGNQKEGKNE